MGLIHFYLHLSSKAYQVYLQSTHLTLSDHTQTFKRHNSTLEGPPSRNTKTRTVFTSWRICWDTTFTIDHEGYVMSEIMLFLTNFLDHLKFRPITCPLLWTRNNSEQWGGEDLASCYFMTWSKLCWWRPTHEFWISILSIALFHAYNMIITYSDGIKNWF